MTSPTGFLEKSKNYLFRQYSGDAGKMLLHTATLGWIFSAAGQIFGIASNDKVSKEQKKFLIPQEIADAAINILSFYTVTACVQNFTKKLASSGRIITPEIRKFCEKNGIRFIKKAGEETPNIGKAILDKAKNLETIIKINGEEKISMSPQKTKDLNARINALNEFYDHKYAPFESGVKIVGNVLGAVLSSNIITPILRNPIAAYKQKQDIARDKMKNDTTMPAPRIILGQNRVGTDNYKNQTSLNVPRITLGGSMRV